MVFMQDRDAMNPLFEMAARFVNHTGKHLFLTGKAGTGKTTFLRYIRDHSHKKMAIVAPTGVAAINAGGVTLHSFFQLPLGAFIPAVSSGWNSQNLFNTPHTLFKNLKLNRDKRRVIQELELLVIDEVSMLRADILDEIDLILRHVRKQPLNPFGGVQMLYIGDLFQLPPVVKNEDWQLLQQYYKSPFFFDAQVMQQASPLYLELKKIYRQHDDVFINLLNNIRNNEADTADLEKLHRYYKPGFESRDEDRYITLSTHNAKADAINQQKLNQLSGAMHEFPAIFSGDFNENALPAEKVLQLKEGAQVMFIKNDKGESRRYYNGKIATISGITEDDIFVQFAGEENEMALEQETWRQIQYRYNDDEDTVDEEELGTFKQYPIRLAWAITIHKSQGLTFEKAVIDAGASFAPGQVYVALSRLTSLDGLVLLSRIHSGAIQTDERVLAFCQSEQQADRLQELLQEEQQRYLLQSLLRIFDWAKMLSLVQQHYDGYEKRQIPDKPQSVAWSLEFLTGVKKLDVTGASFIQQLQQIIPGSAGDQYKYLHERVTAGSLYFKKELTQLTEHIQAHIEKIKIKKRVTKYLAELQSLKQLLDRKQQELEQAVRITEGLTKGTAANSILDQLDEAQKALQKNRQENNHSKPAPKAAKGESLRISLGMFREGITVEGIAEQRGLTQGTIENHLIGFIKTGEVQVEELVAPDKVRQIMKLLDDLQDENPRLSAIKDQLGEPYSYNDIRAVLHHREWQQQEMSS